MALATTAHAQAPQPERASPEDEAAFAAALASDAQQEAGTDSGSSGSPASSSSQNPDIGFTLDLALSYFSEDEPLQTGHHDPDATGFTLQQAELSLQHAVDPYFRLDAFIVLGEEGVELEEAYATTLALPAGLQARAGVFFTRFGRINATHPHAWEFLDQPIALGRVFGGDGSRGPGLELSWLTPLPWYVELIGSANEARESPTFVDADALTVDSPLDFQLTGALKQFFELSPDWSLVFGLSTAHGRRPEGDHDLSEVYGTDLYLKWRPITHASDLQLALQIEALYRRREVFRDHLQDASGYAQLAFRFARRWSTALRYELASPTWDEDGDRTADTLDPEWPGRRTRGALSVSFHPSEFSRLRLQGAVDDTANVSKPGWALMLAGEFTVGAHGAHAF